MLSYKEEKEKMGKAALKLTRDQIKKHSLGKLEFLAAVGTRPWGIAQKNVDYDYRGIYSSGKKNSCQTIISDVYINNHAKDITLINLEKYAEEIFQSHIHPLIVANSPVIYASKEFLEFKNLINSNFSKQIYWTCRTKPGGPTCRKDYLYDFFFKGNGIAVLEKKKIIANLPELNKKVLKIPDMDKVIAEEKSGLPFKTKKICEKILHQLKTRLEKDNKNSRLPEEVNRDKFAKLKIMKKVNYKL